MIKKKYPFIHKTRASIWKYSCTYVHTYIVCLEASLKSDGINKITKISLSFNLYFNFDYKVELGIRKPVNKNKSNSGLTNVVYLVHFPTFQTPV